MWPRPPPARAQERGGSRLDTGDASGGGVNVALLVGVVGLLGRESVAQGGLGSPVLGTLASAEEGRDGNGDQDGDDQNDDHELDEGETLLPILHALANCF